MTVKGNKCRLSFNRVRLHESQFCCLQGRLGRERAERRPGREDQAVKEEERSRLRCLNSRVLVILRKKAWGVSPGLFYSHDQQLITVLIALKR